MPNYRLCKSLDRLRTQINEQNPNRDKTSDGWIGDTSHRARKSDHNPNAAGVVTAIDVDENLTGPTGDAFNLVHALQRSRDPRIKYLIYERQITVPGDITKWQAYHGPSPHDHHFHISVSSDPKLYDDARDWNIGSAAVASPVTQPTASGLPQEAQGDPGEPNAAQPPTIVVESGDTLWGLARRHGVTVSGLKKLNGLTSDTIHIGQKLRLQ